MPPRKNRNQHKNAAPPPKQTEEQTVVADENDDPSQNSPSDDSLSDGQMSMEDIRQSTMAEDDGQSKTPPRKKTKTSVHLTTELEQTVIEWLMNHEVLYNKKLEGYKDTKRKALLWEKQSEERGLPVYELKTWYSSQRTRYTKLRKTDSLVLQRFSFLAAFTYQVNRRPLVSVSTP